MGKNRLDESFGVPLVFHTRIERVRTATELVDNGALGARRAVTLPIEYSQGLGDKTRVAAAGRPAAQSNPVAGVAAAVRKSSAARH